LAELAAERPEELLGPGPARAAAAAAAEAGTAAPVAFPLLVKLLESRAWLSVQVHPDDAHARRHEGQPFGKAEVWYLLDAEPGAQVLHGLAAPASVEELRAAVAADRLPELLERVPVTAGGIVYNPPGTIHAIGPGVFLYELQQAADLTYRLYDWDRAAAGRALHLEPALAVARLDPEPRHLGSPEPLPPEAGGRRARLCRTEHFEATLVEARGPLTLDTRGERCHVLTVIEGRLGLRAAGAEPGPAAPGPAWATWVVPAALGRYELVPLGGEARCVLASPPSGKGLLDSTDPPD
jgi:mannose-6-phosphate isomerase